MRRVVTAERTAGSFGAASLPIVPAGFVPGGPAAALSGPGPAASS